jgi:hypothetical protein
MELRVDRDLNHQPFLDRRLPRFTLEQGLRSRDSQSCLKRCHVGPKAQGSWYG